MKKNIKKFIKKTLLLLKKCLPKKFYNKFYTVSFSVYKFLGRFLYGLKGLIYLLKRDQRSWEMVKRVFSVMPYSLVGPCGLEATYKLTKLMNQDKIAGNFVELGVARGGSAALMGMAAFDCTSTFNRKLWLFDSFEGLPEPTSEDFDQNKCETGAHVQPLCKGSCLGLLGEVKELMLKKFGFPRDKVFLVKGWFKNTIPIEKQKIGQIAVLRIDADWYEPTKECLEYLYDQVVVRGTVIIDDYHSCFGCKKAVDEFLTNRCLKVKMEFDGRGGCYWIKL